MAEREPAMLLVRTSQGATVAVRFPTSEQARDWEDEHGVEVDGCVPYVSAHEALRLTKP